jgi:dolichol-phosphate mannosyltransferase
VKLACVPGVSVIMPTLNEAGHIQELIQSTASALIENGQTDFEIIVVDDDSPDRTWEKAAGAAAIEPGKLRVIRRQKEHGLTASICDGISAAKYEIIVWMDCDFSHPPEKIPQLLYMIRQGFDVVVNSRYVIGGGEDRIGKGGVVQLILSRMLNWCVRFFLKPSFSDYTSGFVAVRREVLDRISLHGDYGEYFIDFIYRVMRSNFRVCEMPYIAQPRRSGESKTGAHLGQYMKRGWKYLLTVVRLKFFTRYSI